MITSNLSTLKINKLTQAQYDRELEAGNIDPNALYLTPDEEIDLSPYATIEQLDNTLSAALFFKFSSMHMPANVQWSDVTYGGGKFVAIAKNSNIAAYSTDGMNWTQTTLPAEAQWVRVVYGAGVFVAVTYFNNVCAYSYDGINWHQSSMTTNLKNTSLVFDESYYIFYAVPEEGTAYKYTMDGSDWGMDTLPVEAMWTDMTFDGSECIIVARYSNKIVTGNLASWTTRTYDGPSGGLVAVASNGNGLTVALGAEGTGYACWTNDRSTWHGVSVANKPWMDITYGNGKFVAVASGTNSAMYSIDGANWVEVKLPCVASWTNVSYGNGVFTASAWESNVVAVSNDGVTWVGEEKKIVDKNGNDITSLIKSILS